MASILDFLSTGSSWISNLNGKAPHIQVRLSIIFLAPTGAYIVKGSTREQFPKDNKNPDIPETWSA